MIVSLKSHNIHFWEDRQLENWGRACGFRSKDVEGLSVAVAICKRKDRRARSALPTPGIFQDGNHVDNVCVHSDWD